MDESRAVTETTIPTSVAAGLRRDRWLPALLLAVGGLLALVVFSALGAARFLSAANSEFRFGSLSGRVLWHSEAWADVETGDLLSRIGDHQVDGDPERIRAALLDLRPGNLEVQVLHSYGAGGDGLDVLVDDEAEIGPFSTLDRALLWSRVATGTFLVLLGTLAVALRPGVGVTRLFFAFCAALAAHLLGYLALLHQPPLGLTFESAALWLCSVLGVHLFATFPRRLLSSAWPFAVLYLPAVVAAGFGLLSHRSPTLRPLTDESVFFSHVAAGLACLLAVVCQVQQLRTAQRDGDAAAESRARSLLLGVGLGLTPATLLHFLPFFQGSAGWAFNSFAVVVFVGITGHAVVRRNALDVDRFTAAVVGYSATLLLVGTGFALLVVGLPVLLGRVGTLDSPVAVAVMTGLAFVAFQPLYRRTRRWADRWFLREPVEVGSEVQVLQTLADIVREIDVPAAMRAGVDAALMLGVERCELWTRTAAGDLVQSVVAGPGPADTGLIQSGTDTPRPTREQLESSEPPRHTRWADETGDRPRSIPSEGPLAVALLEGSGGLDSLCDHPLEPVAQEELWRLGFVMAAPIIARRRIEALLGVARKRNGDGFRPADRVFLDAIASQVAIALERDWHETLRVGPYRLRGRLGTGGMAEVFLAEKRGPGGFERRVALKRILPHLAGDADAVMFFLDEARIAAQLHHPNIVQVYDIEVFDDTYYLAMELMDGPSLMELMRRAREVGSELPLPIQAALAGALLSALDHAHHRADVRGRPLGIVHRDVKPANVLMSRHGEVKLGDFGIARAESRLHQTQPGLARGTPSYMAPEVHAAHDQAGIASDLFSVGIVLLEVLTLKRSQLKRNPGSQINDLRLPKSLGDARRGRLEGFLRRALAPEPTERFATADEMKRAFLEALGVEPAGASDLADLIAAYDPEPRQPDSTELNAFRPADLTESDDQTV